MTTHRNGQIHRVEAVVSGIISMGLVRRQLRQAAAIFHPSVDLRWLEKGGTAVLTVSDWLDPRPGKRPPPRSRKAKPREDFIVHNSTPDSRRFHRLNQGELQCCRKQRYVNRCVSFNGGDVTMKLMTAADRLQSFTRYDERNSNTT